MLMTGRTDAAVHGFYRQCGLEASKQGLQIRLDNPQ